jgi:hypothetical protein
MKFNKEALEFHLPNNFKGLSKQYMIDCIFNKNIQEKWKPGIGDVIIGETGNVFVISDKHNLVEDLGGPIYMFGGYLCNRGGGCLMNSTACYLMNRDGVNPDLEVYSVSKFSAFRFVPYPHEKE